MKKLYDNLFFNRMHIKFISAKNLVQNFQQHEYQFVEIMPLVEWKENHVLFAVHIMPTNFYHEYSEKIDINKKIILFGDWRRNVAYYRYLKSKGYSVYLVKDQNWNSVNQLY